MRNFGVINKNGDGLMSELYKRIEDLCSQKGINITTLCKESGASRGSLTDLKKGRKQSLSTDTLSKIAIYFNVSVDYLLGNDQKEKPAAISDELTEKDRRDIARNLEKMMNELESSGDLMFDGDPASPEAVESIRQAMAMALEYAKKVNKQKYTPKKYRK